MKYQVKIKTPYDEYTISNMTKADIDELTSSLKYDCNYIFIKIDNYITNKEDILALHGNVLKNTTFIIKEIEND